MFYFGGGVGAYGTQGNGPADGRGEPLGFEGDKPEADDDSYCDR
jgi:hypothetical protein